MLPTLPVLLLVAAALLPTAVDAQPAVPASAQPAAPDAARTEARTRFDRGLARFSANDFDGALAEFERSYALVPDTATRFNIGLVQAALDRPVEASDTLAQVLANRGSLSAEQLARAHAEHAEQTARVAAVRVETDVPSRIQVDDVDVARTPLSAPLRLAAGTHTIAAFAPGRAPARRELRVAGATEVTVSFTLQPLEETLAHVQIVSRLPGCEVWIDGQQRGRTPLPASLAVPPGPHRIALRRAGYTTAKRELQLDAGARAKVRLVPTRDRAAGVPTGRLVLSPAESLRLRIDGGPWQPYTAPITLPTGPHHLHLSRPGYLSTEANVDVAAATDTRVPVSLVPTEATRLAHDEAEASRQVWGFGLLAVGGVIAASSGAVAAWAALTLPDLEAEARAAVEDFTLGSEGPCDTSTNLGDDDIARCEQRVLDTRTSVSDRKTWHAVGFMGLAAGVAAATIGAIVLMTGDDPPGPQANQGMRLLAVPLASHDHLGATLLGRF